MDLVWTSRRDHDLGASVICLVAELDDVPDLGEESAADDPADDPA
jgi:hypothetical protein